MTVHEQIKDMVSTGFTGVPLIVGTNLKNLMKLVEDALESSVESSGKFIKYDMPDSYYSKLWYHETWECVIRPIIAKYLEENMPVCWFKVYYTQKLNPN